MAKIFSHNQDYRKKNKKKRMDVDESVSRGANTAEVKSDSQNNGLKTPTRSCLDLMNDSVVIKVRKHPEPKQDQKSRIT